MDDMHVFFLFLFMCSDFSDGGRKGGVMLLVVEVACSHIRRLPASN